MDHIDVSVQRPLLQAELGELGRNQAPTSARRSASAPHARPAHTACAAQSSWRRYTEALRATDGRVVDVEG